MTRTVDAVVVGSGHNGLVAAAYLARAGWSVEVLEQADRLGGAVATEELTVPGYRHDTFSSWHPLFRGSGAWAELGDELGARGLAYAESDDEVTATVRADGGSVVAHRDLARTVEAFGARDGAVYARRAVIANVTPTQLYGRLLGSADAPAQAIDEARRYRYGRRAGMQIHLALDRPLRWRGDERLDRTPVIHLSDGIDAVARACQEAASGLLPAEPTIVCGQPTVLDPSRAPDGKAILWIQLQEVPYRPTGDAAGRIDVGDGTWTPELVDAYVDRIVDRIGAHVEGLGDAIVGRRALSPQEIERRNPNLVRGDIYAGAADLDQSYLWRPLPSYGSHATPVAGLHQCGASTHPGPGLNAASGRIVARALLAPSPRERLRRGLRLGRS